MQAFFYTAVNFLVPFKANNIFSCLRSSVSSLILTKQLFCMELHLENLKFMSLIVTVLWYEVQSS